MTDVATTESLSRAGFSITAEDQARLVSRVRQRLYGRLRFSTRPWLLPAGGLLACLVGVGLRAAVGDLSSAWAAATAGGVHLALLLVGLARRRRRAEREGPADPRAAFLDDEGQLSPRLEEGERILTAASLDDDKSPPARPLVDVGAGLFQTFWGLLLGGLPLAIGGATAGPGGFALTVAATVVGTGLFGRGLRVLLSTRSAKRLVLTDRRLVAVAGPGAARTLWLEQLRHRPLVLERADGSVTVALDVRPRESVAPLPAMTLWGLDKAEPEEARALAGAAVDARRDVVGEGGP